VERLGWTLVHFLWQGALIAAAYAATRRWMAGPNTRYILACAALAAMMAAPLVTRSWMGPSDAVPVSTHLMDRVPSTAYTSAAAPVTLLETASRVQSAQFLPWIVAIWLVGLIAFWMRLIAGWIVAARIRSTQIRPAPPEWQQTLNRLQARVGVSRPVRLLISALVQTPAVVGWLKPVVLVPIGALAGLPSDQIEALLIHELAHIRRHDYLVNILQSMAEALLFYHPAVWWVSGHIRAEREMCCDDVAVSLTGDVFTYASALAQLEASRPGHLHAAIAANGGSLAGRIGRLLGQSRPVSRTPSGPAVLVTAILLMVAAYIMFAQSTDSPRFDVASVKRNTSAVPSYFFRSLPGGRLTTTNAPLRLLIQNAYNVQSFQISGGEGWIDSDGYDIETKADSNPSQRQLWLMLQSLLEGRFKLRIHRETREGPVYALTAAKGGLKLPQSKDGACDTAPSPPTRGQPPIPPCGSVRTMLGASGKIMEGGEVPMAEFARILSTVVGRTVIDKTNATEKFDVHLEFTPGETTEGLDSGVRPRHSVQTADAGAGPSIAAALQEQLGLKLESTKGPVEVLVIDHVERPAEN